MFQLSAPRCWAAYGLSMQQHSTGRFSDSAAVVRQDYGLLYFFVVYDTASLGV
jgi:hypothetical protein